MLCGHGNKIPIYVLYERQVQCLCNAPCLDYVPGSFHVKSTNGQNVDVSEFTYILTND